METSTSESAAWYDPVPSKYYTAMSAGYSGLTFCPPGIAELTKSTQQGPTASAEPRGLEDEDPSFTNTNGADSQARRKHCKLASAHLAHANMSKDIVPIR